MADGLDTCICFRVLIELTRIEIRYLVNIRSYILVLIELTRIEMIILHLLNSLLNFSIN